MKTQFRLGYVFVGAVLILTTFVFAQKHPLVSAPPTSVKDTLSSSQLSYFGRLGVGVSTGDSIVRVVLSGTAPSLTTNNLFVGDTVGIGTTGAGVGSSGPLTMYYIKDIGNTLFIDLNTGIGQSNAFFGAAVIATRSAIHTISFTPQTNQTGGYWQFLIKATSRTGEVYNDGIPDQQGFDLGSTTPSSGSYGLGTRLKTTDVTCPNWGGGTSASSVGTTVVVNSNSYNIITCALGAGNTNQIGIGYSVAIGADLSTNSQLINPSPSTAHVEGNASSTGPDVYTFFVRHLDNAQAVIDADTIQGKIAVVESVRVTATVDPSLTFYIDSTGVGVGATPCGVTAYGSNAANTTATAVAFGSLTLGAFNDLAQRLSCITNADNGYVVTVYENSQMKTINDGTTIPDTNCDGGCSTTTAAAWATDNTHSEWGYSIQNLSVGVSIFSHLTGYRAFGVGAANAKSIMSNTAVPTATEQAYVCYRLTASTTQQAGNYENKLIYTATATF